MFNKVVIYKPPFKKECFLLQNHKKESDVFEKVNNNDVRKKDLYHRIKYGI